MEKTRPDVVWHLGDPYMGIEPARLGRDGRYRLVYYYPVGYEPLNHYRETWVEKLAAAETLVTPTRFGADVLRAVPGLEAREIPVIPLGVDTTVFRPRDPQERTAVRRDLWGDRAGEEPFILGWVGHDQYRKQVWTLFELLHHLREGDYLRCASCDRVTVMEYDHRLRRPRDPGRLRTYPPEYDYRTCWYCRSTAVERGRRRDDVVLWTVMPSNVEVGWDLRLLADTWNCRDTVFDSTRGRPEEGHTTEEMSRIVSCFDALAFPSGAEGFGMPVLEAMSCGVPVVYSNCAAHAEFAVGLPVRVRFVPDHPDPSWLGYVDMGDLVRSVLLLIEDHELRRRLAVDGRRVATDMDWDAFTPLWIETLAGRTHPRAR